MRKFRPPTPDTLRMLGPSLRCLPNLQHSNVRGNTAEDHTPLPSDGFVFENKNVQLRDVDEREDEQEPCNNGPKQELVVVDSFEDGEGTAPTLIHGKQGLVEMLDLPRSN